MAIQFLRGTSNAIQTSNKTLKKGQPLLDTTNGCLYVCKEEGAVNGPDNKFKYPALENSANATGLVKYSGDKLSIDSNSYVTAKIEGDYLCIYTNTNAGTN